MKTNHPAMGEDLKLVSRYLTPYSIGLVLSGLILRFFDPMEARTAIWILAATVFINIGVKRQDEWLPFKTPSWISDWRVEVNLIADSLLIFLLMPRWPEAWLLLLGFTIAIAVYDSLDATLFYCEIFGLALLLFAWLHGMTDNYRLGQTLMYGATLMFIGLFVNRLISVLRTDNPSDRGVSEGRHSHGLSEKLTLVSRHMTPFAAFLVLMGVVFGHPPPDQGRLAVEILAVTLIVNFGSIAWVKRYPSRAPAVRRLRAMVNILADLWLIWILQPYWPEIWLLLLLIAVAQGIYGTREQILFWSCGCALALFAITLAKNLDDGFYFISFLLPQVIVRGVTYIFIGLFINRLVYLMKLGMVPVRDSNEAKTMPLRSKPA